MDPGPLCKAVLDPNTRKLLKVTKTNVEYCKALLSSTLARRELMLKHGIITDGILKPLLDENKEIGNAGC